MNSPRTTLVASPSGGQQRGTTYRPGQKLSGVTSVGANSTLSAKYTFTGGQDNGPVKTLTYSAVPARIYPVGFTFGYDTAGRRSSITGTHGGALSWGYDTAS